MADNVTTDELQTALEQLAGAMGQSTVEYVQSQGFATEADMLNHLAGVQAQIDAITKIDSEDGVETLAEKIAQIEGVLSDDNGVVQQIFSLITQNQTAINEEVTRATGAETALKTALDNLTNRVTTAESGLTSVTATATDNKNRLDVLSGDENVEGSVSSKVKAEADRAAAKEAELAQSIADETARATTKESELQSQIDSITGGADGSLADVNDRVSALEGDINDTTDADGNLVKGVKTRVSDLEAGLSTEVERAKQAEADVLAQAKAYTDANTLKASSMDICGIGNKFRQALGLGDTSCSSSESGDGAVL